MIRLFLSEITNLRVEDLALRIETGFVAAQASGKAARKAARELRQQGR